MGRCLCAISVCQPISWSFVRSQGGLKEELNEVKSELKVVNEENDRLKRWMEQERPKGVGMTQEVEAKGGLMGVDMVDCDKLGVTMVAGERQKQTRCQHEPKNQRQWEEPQ